MALKRGIVKLEDYNSNWKIEYLKEEKLLKKLLKDYLIEIYHIGSTSIKGVKSKPIVDILLVINSFENLNKIEEILKDYDYHNMGQHGVIDRYFFAKGPDEARSHYLHIVEEKKDTYYNQLYFKKYLTEHKEFISKYNELKEDLAKKYADERAKYTEGKHEFISNAIKLAKEEYGGTNGKSKCE